MVGLNKQEGAPPTLLALLLLRLLLHPLAAMPLEIHYKFPHKHDQHKTTEDPEADDGRQVHARRCRPCSCVRCCAGAWCAVVTFLPRCCCYWCLTPIFFILVGLALAVAAVVYNYTALMPWGG